MIELLLDLDTRLATTISEINLNWMIVNESILEEGKISIIIDAPLLCGLKELSHRNRM